MANLSFHLICLNILSFYVLLCITILLLLNRLGKLRNVQRTKIYTVSCLIWNLECSMTFVIEISEDDKEFQLFPNLWFFNWTAFHQTFLLSVCVLTSGYDPDLDPLDSQDFSFLDQPKYADPRIRIQEAKYQPKTAKIEIKQNKNLNGS